MNCSSDKPELLAPAGSLEAGITAFDYGADAVYLGLARFNARERGTNFSFEDLACLIRYARENGRRVYVTVNTLIKERELPEVFELLAELSLYCPDAIIVQDLGVVRLIRRFFPDIPLHASTQMSIHNSAGVRVLEGMGFERVILQRQVTFDELALIRERSNLGLEVFVHGALCCSRSGGCLFSSWLGGWSGNRGKCKQPCRRRYFSDRGNGFFFSAADLCLIDVIPDLVRIGVVSLKIEGRLRGADYVKSAVRAYRMMLDASPGEQKSVLAEAKRELAGTFGRKWSHGFTTPEDFTAVVEHASLGSSGLLVGREVDSRDNGFTVRLSRGIRRGDRLRVQPESGEEGPSITVTRLRVGGRPVEAASRGETCFVYCDKKVPHRGFVLKTGSSLSGFGDRMKRLEPCLAALPLRVSMKADGIEVRIHGAEDLVWQKSCGFEAAERHALTRDEAEAEFRKSAGSGFVAGYVEADIEPGLFVPNSVLKAARKEFWAWVEEQEAVALMRESNRKKAERLSSELTEALLGDEPGAVTTVRLPEGESTNTVPHSLTARSIGDIENGCDEVILPDFCPEKMLPALREEVKRLLETGFRRFRVTSLFGLDLLRSVDGAEVTAGFPLPVANSLALEELAQHGVTRAGIWVELEQQSVKDLVQRAPGRVELYAYGRLPLLSTRAAVPVSGKIRDSRGIGFRIEKTHLDTRLYPCEVFSIPTIEGVSLYIDLSHAELGEKDTSAFNYYHDFV